MTFCSRSGVRRTTSPLQEHANDLDALLKATRRTINAIEDNLAQIAKTRNFAIPAINRLPLELLTYILELSIAKGDRLRNALRPMFVCRYWRELFEGTPSFWTKIDCNSKTSLVRRAIKASAPLPVEFEFSTSNCNWGTHNLYHISEFWKDVGPFMDRCRTLRLTVGDVSDLKYAEGISAPDLKKLSISNSTVQYWDPEPVTAEVPEGAPVDIFGGDAPNLQELSLTGKVWISWQSKMLAGLRGLLIRRMEHAGPNLSDLTTILRRSPELQVLHLNDLESLTGTEGDDANIIELPFLRDLKLDKLPELHARFFMSHIRAPQCRSFSITPTTDTPASSTISAILECVHHVIEATSAQGMGYGFIKITLNPAQFHFTCSAKRIKALKLYEICVAVSPAMVTEELFAMLETITSALSKFEFHVDQLDGDEEAIGRCISCISRLRPLSGLSINTPGVLEAVLNYLAAPEVLDGTKRWPFPDLTLLRCGPRCGDQLGNILEMVRKRYGTPISSTEERPKPLDKLFIYASPHDQTTWAEIGRVIGQEHTEVIEVRW